MFGVATLAVLEYAAFHRRDTSMLAVVANERKIMFLRIVGFDTREYLLRSHSRDLSH